MGNFLIPPSPSNVYPALALSRLLRRPTWFGLSQFVHYGFSVGAVGWERGRGSSSVALTV